MSFSGFVFFLDGSAQQALRVGLGVGGVAIASGSRARPTHLCDRWVCDLGTVGDSSVFGWVRGVGVAQQFRGNGHFLSVVSSSRHKTMVGGALARFSLVVQLVDLIFISRYF